MIKQEAGCPVPGLGVWPVYANSQVINKQFQVGNYRWPYTGSPSMITGEGWGGGRDLMTWENPYAKTLSEKAGYTISPAA